MKSYYVYILASDRNGTIAEEQPIAVIAARWPIIIVDNVGIETGWVSAAHRADVVG